MPLVGVDRSLWIIVMGILAGLALPLTLLEYYFTKERVTEEQAAIGDQKKIPFLTQLKVVLTDKYMLVIFIYFLIYTFGSYLKNTGLVYYCNWVLGKYNDGITQMLVSVIGGVPMGIGIFAVWPLAKKFGKRNVTMWGFVLYAIGSAICWMAPTNLVIVLVGQFIKNIGGLPCAYVFMALFADSLDHVEWKSGIRCDGVAMSIYGMITVVLSGICIGVFNALLANSGYIAPPDGATVEQIQQMVQPESVKNTITFCFVGLEVITGAISAALLILLSVEKTLSKKQALIREHQKQDAISRGETWIEPEIRLAEEQKASDIEAEEIFKKELLARCNKKGLNYEEELAKHVQKMQETAKKQEQKRLLAEEKESKKAQKAEQKRLAKLSKLTKEQLEVREKKAQAKKQKEDKAWEIERQKGEEFRAKIQAELAQKQ